MRTPRRSATNFLVILGFVVILGALVSRPVEAQPPLYDEKDLPALKREAAFSFTLTGKEDVEHLSKTCRIAVLEATVTLERFSRKELTNDSDEPRRAVMVLRMFGGGGSRGLRLLTDNMLKLKHAEDESGSPLRDFIAAQALVAIGGARARTAILDSLRRPLDHRELLIRAHVLAQMEPPTIMREYLRLALEEQEERERVRAVEVNNVYKSNLELMNAWISNPVFMKDRDNWP